MTSSKEDVDAGPFDFMPDGFDGRRAALCLHGLTGTPYEVRPVADALVQRGMRCVAPVMAGHDVSAKQLAKTPYTAWVDLARNALVELSETCEQVFIAGMSMGGLVALALAGENRADGIAVMGAPIRLPLYISGLVPVVKYVYPYLSKSGGADIQDEQARLRHPGLDAMPLASVHELVKLQRVVRGAIPKITAPTFVGHGALDRTANPKDARSIFAGVNTDVRELRIGARSGHVVSVDHDGPEMARAIANFFDGIGRRTR